MTPRPTAIWLALALALGGCGQPAAVAPAAPPATAVIGHDIASLLRDPPKPGAPVEIDVYNWADQRGAVYDWDAERCPELATGSLLTDRPVVYTLPFPLAGQGNRPSSYPPDSEAWLIPFPLRNVAVALDVKYPPPSVGYPAPSPTPTPDPIVDAGSIAYHMRVRGYLGEPVFAHCPNAARIFVIEHVLRVYEQTAPHSGTGSSELPAQFDQWQLYHDTAQGFRFTHPAGWKVTPITDSPAVAAVAIQRPDLPAAPIIVRVFADQEAQGILELSRSRGRAIGSAMLRQSLGLSGNWQDLAGYVSFGNINATTGEASVVYSKRGRAYELHLRYPVGYDADYDLMLTYQALVASFEVDGWL